MILLNDTLDNEKEFNAFIQYLSVGDHERSNECARTLLKGIRATLGKIQRDYSTLLIDSRIPEFPEDEKAFASGGALSGPELAKLAPRLESYVEQINHEVHHLRRREPSKWRAYFFRYSKVAALGAAGVLVAIGLFMGGRKIVFMGRGLSGEYYGDTEMGILYRKRIDPQIDFNWGRQSPFKKWRKDRFSARWNGFLLVPETGRYDIYLHMDDGARLYLDDKIIVDEWRAKKLRVVQVPLDLKYGYHPIRLEYFEKAKYAVIRLFWRRADNPRPEPIPAQFLCPSDSARKKGVPVFGIQETPDDGSEKSDSEGDDDDAGETGAPAAPQAPPPAKG